MALPEDLPQAEREMWKESDLAQPDDNLPRTNNQEHFRRTYVLPNLKDVMNTVTDNMEKNQAKAAERGRADMANPPSREP